MRETGQEAPGGFVAEPEDLPPCSRLRRRGREQEPTARQHRGRRWMWAPGVASAVAAAGGVAAVFAAAAGHAPSALTAVTDAVTKTSAGSYSFSLNSTVRFAGQEVSSSTVIGAFDPRRALGSELLTTRTGTSQRAQIRFIGEYVYAWKSSGSQLSKPWDKAPAPPSGADVLRKSGPYGFSTEQPVSADELLVVLRSAATVRDEASASGPGWTGIKYGFTARLSTQESVSGTVDVDRQGRVRRMMTIATVRAAAPGTGAAITTDRDFTFGDFGAPISVTAPLASAATYTSVPYWGLFF
jgi:hypothetical protein